MEISITMDVYIITFAILLASGGFLAYSQHKNDVQQALLSKEGRLEAAEIVSSASQFMRRFIPVYLLVMASDWLQGAYVYTLYKDEKQLAESVVAALFTSGFLSAAISALFVGSLADKHGRRLACQVFCVAYAVSCFTKISNDVSILFIGRLLGGLCTTLLFSTFESWMVTEYLSLQLDKSSLQLSAVFGVMTMLNSIVAIASGVVGESLVSATGTKVSPFLAAAVCLGLAFFWMFKYWGENYGDRTSSISSNLPTKSALKQIYKDRNILLLTFISCCFEGSMYIMVFFWSAAMTRAHALTYPDKGESKTKAPSSGNVTPEDHNDPDIPFGLIFATFMAAMMIGSLTYSRVTSPSSRLSQYLSPSTLLTLTIAGASISLMLVVLFKNESITFWCFCIFEACIGIYYPSMGVQKSRVVEDRMRANVYGIMRIPLNIFVVVALTTTVEGDLHRDRVFVVCGGLLLLASVAAGLYLEDAPKAPSYTSVNSDLDIAED